MADRRGRLWASAGSPVQSTALRAALGSRHIGYADQIRVACYAEITPTAALGRPSRCRSAADRDY
jgi:hypothetical protein